MKPFLKTYENISHREWENSGDSLFESMAKHLRIEVFRDNRKKVSLTLPATAIEDLHNMIDDEVTKRIKTRGIELATIIQHARRSGYAPSELFELEIPEESKLICVWLD